MCIYIHIFYFFHGTKERNKIRVWQFIIRRPKQKEIEPQRERETERENERDFVAGENHRRYSIQSFFSKIDYKRLIISLFIHFSALFCFSRVYFIVFLKIRRQFSYTYTYIHTYICSYIRVGLTDSHWNCLFLIPVRPGRVRQVFAALCSFWILNYTSIRIYVMYCVCMDVVLCMCARVDFDCLGLVFIYQ